MKRLLPLLSAFSVLALPAAAGEAAPAAPASPAAPAPRVRVPAVALERDGFYETWIRDRLTLGLGVSCSVLTDSERPKDADRKRTFLGYIWKLEDADQAGIVPELRYRAADNLRLALGLDRVSARTRNFNQAKHSDGTADARGPEVLVEGLLPLLDDTLFLHAGVGFVYDFSDFEEITWWHLGYASRDAWIARGSPKVHTAQDHYREIKVDDAFGLAVAAGATWRPHPRFELDLSLRHVWLEPDCQFGYTYSASKGGFKKQQDGEFTLDHLVVAITGSYVF